MGKCLARAFNQSHCSRLHTNSPPCQGLMHGGLWDSCALRANLSATTGLFLGGDQGTHEMMPGEVPPHFSTCALFTSQGGCVQGPEDPVTTAPDRLHHSASHPPACLTPTIRGRLGSDSWSQCTSPVHAAMPTLFPWQWAPNGRLPGKAKMPEK